MSIRSLVVMLLASGALSSCGWMSRHGEKCREPVVPAGVINNPALKAGAGLDAPDTRNAVKVPELTEPEKPGDATSKCLSLPPSYGS